MDRRSMIWIALAITWLWWAFLISMLARQKSSWYAVLILPIALTGLIVLIGHWSPAWALATSIAVNGLYLVVTAGAIAAQMVRKGKR